MLLGRNAIPHLWEYLRHDCRFSYSGSVNFHACMRRKPSCNGYVKSSNETRTFSKLSASASKLHGSYFPIICNLSFNPNYFVAKIVFFVRHRETFLLVSTFKCIFLSLDCKNSHKWGIGTCGEAVILQRNSE